MYTTREALAYTGKLPMQQAAITPQLLDLLALQKVEADKKAAAQQLAMASGQPQPTVAQGLQQRAMQSARQEISQKMGLRDLAQPPAGPMPQGLAGAPTNLPTEYRGGGIIAFAEGGSGGDAHGRFRQQEVEQLDVPVESEDQSPQMSAENAEFIRATQVAAAKLRDQDPEALGKAEMAIQQEMLNPNREAAIARKREQQAGLKALYERQIAERPSGLRVALDRIAQNINQPGGFGAAMQGVSQAGQAAREGYTKQEIAQLNALSAIDDEIEKAIENNDVGKYNAYVARKKEVRAEMKSGLEASATMSNVLESAQARKENRFLEDKRKRELAAAEIVRKREALDLEDKRIRDLADDRLMQLKIARAGAGDRSAEAREARNQTTALTLATSAANKAMADPVTAAKLPAGTTADELALQYYKKFYDALSSGKGVAPEQTSQKTITQADIQATAKSSGKSVDEVMAAAKAKGYVIK
jgi:hypothetical protein